MLRPAVEVLERYAGIVVAEKIAEKEAGRRNNGPLTTSVPACKQPLEPRPGQTCLLSPSALPDAACGLAAGHA
jgi:hypothetical protein